MRDVTKAKCRKAQDLIKGGGVQSQVMKKLKLGVNTYYEFLELNKKKVRPAASLQSNILERLFDSNLSNSDKADVMRLLVGHAQG